MKTAFIFIIFLCVFGSFVYAEGAMEATQQILDVTKQATDIYNDLSGNSSSSSSSSSSSGSGTQANPIRLPESIRTNNVWSSTAGRITSSTTGGAVWYSFNVTSGDYYMVSWDDADYDSSLLDIKVDAYYQDGSSIFTGVDAGGEYFYNSRNDTVLLKVYPYSSGSTGTFRITWARPRS